MPQTKPLMVVIARDGANRLRIRAEEARSSTLGLSAPARPRSRPTKSHLPRSWVQTYPNDEVARWLGHPPLIAATHYWQPRERYFAEVVAGGQQGASGEAPGPVHICVQSEAAPARSVPHEPEPSSGKAPILQNAANHREPRQTAVMGDIGLEPMTPSLSS